VINLKLISIIIITLVKLSFAQSKNIELEVYSSELNKDINVRLDTVKERYQIPIKEFIKGRLVVKNTMKSQYCSNLESYLNEFPTNTKIQSYVYEMTTPQEVQFVMTKNFQDMSVLDLEVKRQANKKGYWVKSPKNISKFSLDKVEFAYTWDASALSLKDNELARKSELFLINMTVNDRSRLYDFGWAKGNLNIGTLFCDLLNDKVKIRSMALGKETTNQNDNNYKDFEVLISAQEIRDINAELNKMKVQIESQSENHSDTRWISNRGIMAAAALQSALSKETQLSVENLTTGNFINLFFGFFDKSKYQLKMLSDSQAESLANSLIRYVGGQRPEIKLELETKELEIEVKNEKIN
jgi:hypothetical protein